MADTVVEGLVPLNLAEAFEIYVEQIDTWWPRQGVFPFSFAPKSTRPLHIQFEPGENGRFLETFLDSSEYEIGRITEWHPPKKLGYTWKDPTWQSEITTTIAFNAVDGGTRFVMEQNGFAAAGQPHLPPYYEIGNRQTLAGYIAHCTAVKELRQLQQNLDRRK